MYKYKEVYLTLERPAKTSEDTINIVLMNPKLVRRLLNLHLSKSDFESRNNNPWYNEAQQAGITYEVIKNAKDFVKYCNQETQKERKKYMDALISDETW